nr:hypothetical protein [Solirubrobacteraceae bacterium]
MRVLLGTTFLNCLSGSELFVYDVARGLSARGHEVTVWVRDLVPAAPLPRLLAHHGVRTTRDLPEDGGADAVIFQLKETFPVFASRHLDVPRLAICHGPKLPAEVAPADFPGTVHVALTREGEEYLVSAGYEQVAFTGYGIDLGRFSAMGEPPQRLRRAVAHSKYADMEVIRGACEELGIELTVLGRESWRPGFDLDHYADLVLVGED